MVFFLKICQFAIFLILFFIYMYNLTYLGSKTSILSFSEMTSIYTLYAHSFYRVN